MVQWPRPGDDNCHYQTTELLVNELIRHNKQFRMFAYPNRTHAIREGKNTPRHLRELMTRYLLEKLPPTPSHAVPEKSPKNGPSRGGMIEPANPRRLQ